MYWPHRTTELSEYISKCDICLAHRASTRIEPLLQHEFVRHPRSKIGANLCQMQGHTLLVVCDYFSNFIEAERIIKSTTHGVMKTLKTMFAIYGTPDVLISDNGLQLDSTEFATFWQ